MAEPPPLTITEIILTCQTSFLALIMLIFDIVRSYDVTKPLIKRGTRDEAFQEQSSPWERGASVSAVIGLLNLKAIYMHAEGKEQNEKKA